jgi:Ca2+-binding EF-hand superfamily protein
MKKVFTRSLLLSFCLLLAGAAAALAVDTPPAMQGDAGKDGALTCSEAKTYASDRFTAMDTNKDKTLNMDEMEEGMTSIFKEMDTDKNGMVNVEEYVTYWCGAAPKTKKASAKGNKQPQFKKMDRNNDGKIDVVECTAVWTVRFADADANKDGKLTKQEYVQSLILWFADTDANRDSSITVTEWTNYWIGKCQAEKMKKALGKK